MTLAELKDMNKRTRRAEKIMSKSLSIQKQSGMATLVFSLVVLFTLTITTVFGSRVALLDEKMSSNDYRGKESFAAAEAGMDAAITAINLAGNISTGPTYTGTISSTGGVYLTYTATATQVRTTPSVVYEIVSRGCVGTSNTICGGTLESESTVSQRMAIVTLMRDAPSSPMVMAGTISAAGAWMIVGKEGATHACGTGSLSGNTPKCSGLLSIWSNSGMESFKGASQSCFFDDFLSMGSVDDVWGYASKVPICATTNDHSPLGADDLSKCYCNNAVSGKWSMGPYVDRSAEAGQPSSATWLGYKLAADIVAPPVVDQISGYIENFPQDLFAYVFGGVSESSYQTIKGAVPASRKFTNCSSIGPSSRGLYWITGNCSLNNKVVGSPNKPVLLVVEDGQVGGAKEGFGLLFGWDNPDTAGIPELDGNGGLWYGGIIIDGNGDRVTGNGKLVYREGVFDALKQEPTLTVLSVVPGTWKDF